MVKSPFRLSEECIKKSHLYPKESEDPTASFFCFYILSNLETRFTQSRINGKDEGTDREKLHLHVLRKYFRTMLGASGLQVDVIEALMGCLNSFDVFSLNSQPFL